QLQVFRYAYKAWAFAAPALAVLSALGLEELLAGSRGRAVGVGALVLGVGAAALGGGLRVFHIERARLVDEAVAPALRPIAGEAAGPAAAGLAVRGLVLAAVGAALAGAASARSGRTRARRLLVLAGFGLLDVTVTAHRATPLVERAFYETP